MHVVHGGFNPRARKGRDTAPRCWTDTPRCFNPRARKGRDTVSSASASTSALFQSTRPQRARLRVHGRAEDAKQVSIHAPAKGATAPERYLRMRQRVSIHAPAKGATGDFRIVGVVGEFQSTRPQRARHPRPPRSPTSRSFNPRARKGRDR